MNQFLFARPSFFGGTAGILDFGNSLFEYNYSESGEQADYIAIQSDWVTVGDDMWSAVAVGKNEMVEP